MTIDLDTVERTLDYPYMANGVPVVQFTFADTVRQLVAELRAAREVVKATRPWHDPSEPGPCDICRALAAYDQTTGGDGR